MTLNLKLKDIDMATEAKHYLEEKQRGEARERKENERQWETRVRLLLLLLSLADQYQSLFYLNLEYYYACFFVALIAGI